MRGAKNALSPSVSLCAAKVPGILLSAPMSLRTCLKTLKPHRIPNHVISTEATDDLIVRCAVESPRISPLSLSCSLLQSIYVIHQSGFRQPLSENDKNHTLWSGCNEHTNDRATSA